ncbi:MAG TPA: MerR family transcriptional regulator [Chromatiaceae bacterium]|nr:MAG: MerR family transcriptional regulator [Thiohalocapsa sp. PB-PSB1]HBG96740.1 MerR family transcriptional regulator [Chromatiaceae bacterium]HCS88728.1 MerR family transcriptional regulator [Chromatiaceae bacterium]
MPDHESEQTYRIGAVARLTGIPPDTLRVWERRYTVVTPFRSDAGTRLYRAEDVGRLTLIKRLVDNGDAISHVAGLSFAQLRDRVQGLTPQSTPTESRPCRVAVFGSSLPVMLESQQTDPDDQDEAIQFVGLFTDEVRFREEAGRLELDLAVVEWPTIHQDQLRDLTELLSRVNASRALIIYDFASRSVVERLESQQITAKRAPVDAIELKRWCLALHGAAANAPMPLDILSELNLGAPIPPRRYDSATLTQIAAISPAVRCECPHHLVQLITSLASFEKYSRECENRNLDDAALHAFLHAATAQARATMEAAMARVIEAEGIEI